jgi:hypothetical protein
MIEQGAAYGPKDLLNAARTQAVEALALSREAVEPAGVADALLVLGLLDMADSLPHRRRRALAEEALTYAREAGDDRLVAFALLEQASTIPLEDDTGELERAATALRKLGGARALLALYTNASYGAIKAGRPHTAGPFLGPGRPTRRGAR